MPSNKNPTHHRAAQRAAHWVEARIKRVEETNIDGKTRAARDVVGGESGSWHCNNGRHDQTNTGKHGREVGRTSSGRGSNCIHRWAVGWTHPAARTRSHHSPVSGRPEDAATGSCAGGADSGAAGSSTAHPRCRSSSRPLASRTKGVTSSDKKQISFSWGSGVETGASRSRKLRVIERSGSTCSDMGCPLLCYSVDSCSRTIHGRGGQFGPNILPIFWPKNLTFHSSIGRPFNFDAYLYRDASKFPVTNSSNRNPDLCGQLGPSAKQPCRHIQRVLRFQWASDLISLHNASLTRFVFNWQHSTFCVY